MTPEKLVEKSNQIYTEAKRAKQPKAWLVRGNNVDGHDLVPSWLADGIVTLSARYLREVPPHIMRDELKVIVDEDYSHATYAQRGEKLDELLAFLSKMAEGDIVATVRQSRLYLGRLTGEVNFQESPQGKTLVRGVSWVGSDGIDYADLPNDLANRLHCEKIRFRDIISNTHHSLTALNTRTRRPELGTTRT